MIDIIIQHCPDWTSVAGLDVQEFSAATIAGRCTEQGFRKRRLTVLKMIKIKSHLFCCYIVPLFHISYSWNLLHKKTFANQTIILSEEIL